MSFDAPRNSVRAYAGSKAERGVRRNKDVYADIFGPASGEGVAQLFGFLCLPADADAEEEAGRTVAGEEGYASLLEPVMSGSGRAC